MAGVVRWEDEGLVAEERGAEVAMEMGDMMRWGESVDTGVGEEGLEEEEIQVAAEGVVGEEMVPEADWGALGDCTVADCKEDQGAQELVRLVAEEVVTMVAGEREANVLRKQCAHLNGRWRRLEPQILIESNRAHLTLSAV